MNEYSYTESISSKNTFWDNVAKYASTTNKDESFVSEIAYMMVTLHRTGA